MKTAQYVVSGNVICYFALHSHGNKECNGCEKGKQLNVALKTGLRRWQSHITFKRSRLISQSLNEIFLIFIRCLCLFTRVLPNNLKRRVPSPNPAAFRQHLPTNKDIATWNVAFGTLKMKSEHFFVLFVMQYLGLYRLNIKIANIHGRHP